MFVVAEAVLVLLMWLHERHFLPTDYAFCVYLFCCTIPIPQPSIFPLVKYLFTIFRRVIIYTNLRIQIVYIFFVQRLGT